jgi:hypothetical protein
MNADKQRTLVESSRRNPFWSCCVVFLLLAGDYGYRLASLWDQREQLNQAALAQAQNMGALKQAQQLEARLEGFSLELLQVAQTNAAAKQIIQDFNIQWNPGPAASAPAPAAGTQKK